VFLFGGTLPEFLTRNWLEKVVSLLLAVLLWVYVTGQEKSEMSFTVPLELTNIPPDMEIINEPPGYITIRVRGNSHILTNIKPGKIKVVLDLSHLKEGKNTFTVSRGAVILPRGLVVTKVNPTTVTIKAEKVVERKATVILKARGLRKRWRVSLDPPLVTIQGVKSQIKRVRIVKTQELDLTNTNLEPGKTLKRVVELVPPGKGIYLFPDRVTVMIENPAEEGNAP